MFARKVLTIFSVGILMVVAGCSLPSGISSVSTQSNQSGSQEELQTQVALSIAQTVVAQTVAAVNGPAATEGGQQPADTLEFTFTPTFTPTETFTDTPSSPMVTVSVETNCRTGPGTPYDVLGVLPAGVSAVVIGQYPPSNYWIIQLPSNPAITCWLWGQYGTVTGDTSALTTYTPPPTPTPKYTATPTASFQVTYKATEMCGVQYGIKFQITNNGNVTWESNRVILTDEVTSQTVTVTRDNFPNYSGCLIPLADLNLDPTEIGITTSSGLSANPSGHNLTATIRVCSQNGMLGTCLEKTITFIP